MFQDNLSFLLLLFISSFFIWILYKLRSKVQNLSILNHELEKTNEAYSRFVPQDMLSYLNSSGISNIKKGDHATKEITVLFSDIRAFTTLSEKTESKPLLEFLNHYFEVMNQIIISHGGKIDKYMGDAILAIFPDSTDEALRSAIEMINYVRDNQFELDGAKISIDIGIGMHYGEVVVGVVGGESLLQTTVLSDVVNTTSRLESMTKEYNVSIIVSEELLHNIEEISDFYIRFLDYASIRGKEGHTYICEIYNSDNEKEKKLKQETKKLFDNGVTFFQNAQYGEAWESFLEVLKVNPRDKVALYYLSRTANFLVQGFSVAHIYDEDIVKWDNQWETGISAIDIQHKSLFVIINDLGRAIKHGRELEVLKRLFNNLKIYTYTHFTLEEELMLKFNYPDFNEHKIKHLQFIGEILDAEKEVQTGNPEVPTKILNFLSDWLIRHIQHSDRDGYAPYINKSV